MVTSYYSSFHQPTAHQPVQRYCKTVCWQEAETEGFVELSSSLLGYEILLSTTLKETPSQDTYGPVGHMQHFSPPLLLPSEQH